MFFADFDLPTSAASSITGAGISWPDVALSFFAIVLEGAPFLLLGAIVSGLVDVFLPAGVIKGWLPHSKTQGMFAAIGAGFIFPLCECGAMPIVQRLIRKGVPPAVATTYMLAAPGLNPLAMFSTWLAFRNQDPWLMVVLRFGFSFLVLLFLGFWLIRLRPDQMLRAETLIGPIKTKPEQTPNPGLILTPRPRRLMARRPATIHRRRHPRLHRRPPLPRHWRRRRRDLFYRLRSQPPRAHRPKHHPRSPRRHSPRATALPLQHHRRLHHRRLRALLRFRQNRLPRRRPVD